MQILWLVKTTLPQAAAACGLAGASDVSGSWLTGQLAALQAHPALHLTVLCVGKAGAAGRADGVDYRIVTGTAAFAPLLQQMRPDLVHIWGTEYDAAAAMAEAAKAAGLPVLFSIQGVMRDCAAHLCDGVPAAYRRSGALWHTLDRIVPGELLDTMQASFDALAAKEAALLAQARYVTGRTAFDRSACAALAPAARYFACNETLRPLFYTGTPWHAREFGAAPVLFLPQGNYPLKNLHCGHCPPYWQLTAMHSLSSQAGRRLTKALCCAPSLTGCSPTSAIVSSLPPSLALRGTSAIPARWTPPRCVRHIWRPMFFCCPPAVKTAPTVWGRPCCWVCPV